ncbi:hypothetical protein Tco_1333619, partial [Tanacetum coccineum]
MGSITSLKCVLTQEHLDAICAKYFVPEEVHPRLTVEQGVPALPTLPFITSSVTALPLEEGGDRTDSVTGPSLRTIGLSARFVVLFDSSHHSGAKSVNPEVDSLTRSDAPVMTKATTITIPTDVSKDKSAPHPSVFGS